MGESWKCIGCGQVFAPNVIKCDKCGQDTINPIPVNPWPYYVPCSPFYEPYRVVPYPYDYPIIWSGTTVTSGDTTF